ncbi:unnamed protein product, partial [Onchocerca ochengi]
ETKSIFGDAAMNIREFLSNGENFKTKIAEQDRANMEVKKILRINWDHVSDIVKLTAKPWNGKELTKRAVLQFVASQYNPLGFLVPIMIRFKLLLQSLWKKNSACDQLISDEDSETWNSLISDWPTNIKELPRFITDYSNQIQVHFFTGASSVAYSAAVYLPSHRSQGRETRLVFAKSRIEPIKGMTTPRPELLAILQPKKTIDLELFYGMNEELICAVDERSSSLNLPPHNPQMLLNLCLESFQGQQT